MYLARQLNLQGADKWSSASNIVVFLLMLRIISVISSDLRMPLCFSVVSRFLDVGNASIYRGWGLKVNMGLTPDTNCCLPEYKSVTFINTRLK